MRIDKFLGSLGTRSEIRKLLKSGAVTYKGEVIRDSGFQVPEGCDEIFCRGEKVIYKRFIYLVMNKPQGYISATRDNKLPVVTDLIGEEHRRFGPYPVGRLDIDTEGLLLITNDGELAHELTSPKKEVFKRYMAITDIPMEKADADAFSAGMELSDFTAKPARLEFTDDPNTVFITISEGKFHQVKRMCGKCGKHVSFLKRVAIGGLELDEGLAPGAVYELTKDELIKRIYKK